MFRAVPVRRRGVRARPGPQARRVPDQRLAHRPGLLRVRGLHRPPAGQARRATFQGWVQISAGCNMKLLVLHRARPRAGARSRGRSTSSSPRSRGLAADGVREVTLLGQNVNSYGARPARREPRRSPSCCTRSTRSTGIDRIRYTSPHPQDMKEDVVRAHAELRDASASTSTCRCSRAPRGCSSAMRRTYDARALPRPRRADPRARARTARSRPTSSSASRGRPRRTSRETLEVAEEVGFDGAFTFIYSPRRDTEAADVRRRLHPARGAGRAHGAARRGRPAPRPRARPALRRAHARRARRGPLAPRPVAAARPHAPQQGRQLRRPRRSRARSSPVEITAATSQTLTGEQASLLLARSA